MPQTSFTENMTAAFAGQIERADIVVAMENEDTAAVAFGLGVKFGTLFNQALLPTTENSVIAGITCHSHAYSTGTGGELDANGAMEADTIMNVMRKGQIWVVSRLGNAVGDRLWVRAVAGGAEVQGACEAADDSTDTVDCRNQGVFLTAASAGGLALLEVDFTARPGA